MGASVGLFLFKLVKVLHVQINLFAPLRGGHVPEPCAYQHQRAVAVRKATYDSGTAPDLTVDPLDPVIGTDV